MDVILKYFPELTEQQIRQFSLLGGLYSSWNERINVISRKDIENLYTNHILHSLAIAKIIRFTPSTRILDVGTGGGFPGIPLAVMFPFCHFSLVDSVGKKIKIVNDVIRSTGLKNAQGINTRVESVNDEFDFVVCRAVTSFPKFYTWIKGRIIPEQKNQIRNGILYLKGGNIDEEMKDFKNKIQVYPIRDFFTEDYFDTKLVIYLPL